MSVTFSCMGIYPRTVLEKDVHMLESEAREQSLRLTQQSPEQARQRVILALESPKQDSHKFEANLVYVASSRLPVAIW